MEIENKIKKYSALKTQKTLFAGQVVLRFMAAGTALAAAYTIFTGKETTFIFGFYFTATWTYSPAFKYVAYADAVACGCCALSLMLVMAVGRPGSNPSRYFAFFLHDLAMMAMMTGACAAGTAVAWVGKYGNEHTGWIPICDHFVNYCNRLTVSFIFTYVSCFCFLLLTIMSATIF